MPVGAFLTRGVFARLFPVCVAAVRPSKSRPSCFVDGVTDFATDFIGALLAVFFRTMPDINRVSITCQTGFASASATPPNSMLLD
jgi:hypothetical protein